MSTQPGVLTRARRAVLLSLVLAVFGLAALASSGGKANGSETASSAVALPAEDESKYVGSETCKTCHQDEYDKFKETKMGKMILGSPRNSIEARGAAKPVTGPDARTLTAEGTSNRSSASPITAIRLETCKPKGACSVTRRARECSGEEALTSRVDWAVCLVTRSWDAGRSRTVLPSL